MECKCKNGKFWIGNEWKQRVSCAAQSAAEKAGEWMTNAKECATKKMDADPS